MAFRVHGFVQHADNPNTVLDLCVEYRVAGVLESAVAAANVIDAAAHSGHFGKL
jgi:hypothetical protein